MTDASEADLQRAWRAEYRETWRYTQVEFVKITRSFVAKQPIVGARWLEFRGILQSLAWFYVVGKAEDVDPLLKPGELKRHLESHRKKLRKAQRSVAAIMGNHYLAHEIRKAGSVAIDRDLRKLHGELEYFCHVLDKAEIESGEKDSKGGNRPDETLHEFVRGL